jgi:succinoglycan biosynthesis protein ExoO
MPKVSIIIPTYNVEKYINKCIDSLLNQTEQNFEIIIIDDCSTDNTLKVIKKYSDQRIKILKNKTNSGPSFSRNQGIAYASGKWIALLDSDDWYENNRLEKLTGLAEKLSADLICDDQFLINDGQSSPWGTIFTNLRLNITEPVKIDALYFIKNNLGIKPLIKKEFLIRHNIKFNEDLRYGEDYVLFLECLIKKAQTYLIPEAYYFYRAREGSLVTENIALLNQTLATTNNLIKSDLYSSDREVLHALHERKNKIDESISYYSFVQPLKDKKFFLSTKNLVKRPQVIGIVLKRFPAIIKNRVIRPILNKR